MEALSLQIVWLSTLPRRFGIFLEKICDRHERSGIAVQWNGGGGLHMNTHLPRLFSALTIIMCSELIVSQSMSLF